MKAHVEEKEIRQRADDVPAVLPRVVGSEGLVLKQVEGHEPPLPVDPREQHKQQRGPPVEKRDRDKRPPEGELLGETAPKKGSILPPPKPKIERLAKIEFVHRARKKAEHIEPLPTKTHETGPHEIVLRVAMAMMTKVVLSDDRSGGGSCQQPEPVVEKEIGPGRTKRAPMHVVVFGIGGDHREPPQGVAQSKRTMQPRQSDYQQASVDH